MNDRQWQDSTDPRPMLDYLRPRASARKLRLFAVACCRRIDRWLEDDRSRAAVRVAERYADGRAGEQDLTAARGHALQAVEACHAYQTVLRHAFQAAADAALPSAFDAAVSCAASIGWAANGGLWGEHADNQEKALAAQCRLLRELHGDPFHPVAARRDWLEWSDNAVSALARVIYEERAFGHMPALGDALEQASCKNPAVLAHCRGPGEHARGCWVLDLLLNRD
jgi:hypothetical protein